MSYKNIFYDRSTNLMHLWTDEGYETFEYEPYCYVPTQGESQYQTIFGEYVQKIPMSDNLYGTRYESDMIPEVRTLIDRYHTTTEKAKTNITLSFDIEVSESETHGYAMPPDCFNFITAIKLKVRETGEEWILLYDPYDKWEGDKSDKVVETFRYEEDMLKRFFDLYEEISPSILTGWNIEFYDIPYLYFRTQKVLPSHEDRFSPIGKCHVKEPKPERGQFNYSISIGGVSIMDGLYIYKNFARKKLPSYSLDYTAKHELGRGKVEYEGKLHNLWKNDITKFVDYLDEDVELVDDIEKKTKYVNLAITLAHLTHIPYEYVTSSVQLTEGLIMTYTKQNNLVCPNKPQAEESENKIVGAYVKQSKMGLFEYLFDIDLTSLYPMTDVTLNISLETKVGKIQDYISVWTEKKKTRFRINKPIFDETMITPDMDKEINIIVDYFPENKAYRIKTMGQLYQFVREKNLTMSANGIFYTKDFMGVIPTVILDVFQTRSKYKDLRIEADKSGDEELSTFYDDYQYAYKIVLNTIYGAMLNPYFRFQDRDNGQSITMTGRYTNLSAMDSVFKLHDKLSKAVNLDDVLPEHRPLFDDPIITGDTDSIILSSVPILYKVFGKRWLEMDEDTIMDEVISISAKIAEIANKRAQTFATEWLNSDNNYLEFKEEWVARRGFYVGVKKRYANWIRRLEGAEKDYVDVKGLDIIRSSFPKHLQDFMKNILNKILYGVEKDVIFKYIRDTRSDILKVYKDNILYISVISSANKLQKYIDRYNNARKGAGFHIVGTSYYNQFLVKNNLQNQTPLIKEGDKIGCVYLLDNPYGFDRISFPLDGMHPKVKEFVYEYVDAEESLNRLIDKKLDKFYMALNWEKPNVKYEDISQFLISA